MKKLLKFIAVYGLLSINNQSLAATETELQNALEQQQKQLQQIEQQLVELKASSSNVADQQQSSMKQQVNDKKWQINSYGSLLYKSEDV